MWNKNDKVETFEILVSQSYVFSPLDQFNTDTDNDILYDIIICSFLDKVDLLETAELVDTSTGEAMLSGLASNYFYSDEDTDETEFEDNEENLSNNQSTVLFSNFTGLVPGSEVSTADVAADFFFSFSSLITTVLTSSVMHSSRALTLVYPTGTPIYILPFILAMEVSSYVARAISLGMRLFANLFASHALFKIVMSFGWGFLFSLVPIAVIPTIVLIWGIGWLEVGVGYLQSYVFGSLSSMYFEDAVALGH